MQKDFDKWNAIKKTLQKEVREVYAYPREVWWCSLGVNIGAEADGKNENFERPVLVVRVYNKETLLVLPITSREKGDPFHFKITVQTLNQKTKKVESKDVWIKLTQARVISNKRLLRKVDTVSVGEFEKIQKMFRAYT